MSLIKYLISKLLLCIYKKEYVHGFNFIEYYPSDPLSDGDSALLYGWPDVEVGEAYSPSN